MDLDTLAGVLSVQLNVEDAPWAKSQTPGLDFFRTLPQGRAMVDEMHKVGMAGLQWGRARQSMHAGPEGACGCSSDRRQFINVGQQGQGRSYAAALTQEQALEAIAVHMRDTERLRKELATKLETHGDIILTRWTKKSRDKRAALLCEASPKSFGQWPRNLKPSAEVVKADCDKHRAERPFRRDRYESWGPAPWIDMQDFMEDRMKLLSALHVRAACSASSWAVFDLRQGEPAWWSFNATLWYNDMCVNICEDGYGSLVTYDSGPAHSWALVGFPRAFLLLQLQHEIMVVMNEIADVIIEGAVPSGSAKWSAMVSSGFGSSGDGVLWSTYTHQAFAPPEKYNPRVSLKKAKARLNTMLDEVWLMQTDPNYMHQVIKARRATLSFEGPDTPKDAQLTFVGIQLIVELNDRVNAWQRIVTCLQVLCDTFEAHEEECGPGKFLPSKVNEVMILLRGLLWHRTGLYSRALEDFLPTLQCMRDRYQTAMVDGHLQYQEKEELDPKSYCDRLRWHINELQSEIESEDPVLGLAKVSEDFRREILAQGPTRLIDQRLFDYISDIMLLDELAMAVQWSQHIWSKPKMGDEIVEYSYYADTHSLVCDLDNIRLDEQCVTRLGRAAKLFCEAPWPAGRKDLVWLSKADLCRQRLSLLWKVIREEFLRLNNQEEKNLAWCTEFAAQIMFDSTAEYCAELQQERMVCEEETAKHESLAAAKADSLLEEICQEQWPQSAAINPVRRKQTKAKAERVAAAAAPRPSTDCKATAVLHEPTCASSSDLPVPTVSVKKESLSFFRKMFPPNGAPLQSDTRWQNFLQAMADAGFVVQEAAGSAVSFSNEAGSICFHRPHPDPVIDPIMMHSMAKRIRKWFGFSSETFVLRS